MVQRLQILQGGNLESDTLIIFLQGWPDNYQVWNCLNWKEQLSNYSLLFINFPNTNGKVDQKWGKDFPELCEDTKFTIDQVVKQGNYKKKILVCHDWGCYYSYMLDQNYPGFFDQLIAMDVPGIAEVKGVKALLFVIIYQMILAISFLIGGSIGKLITQKMSLFFRHSPTYHSGISGAQNYPYYYLWKNKILGGLKLRPSYLKGYKPSVPIVYMYAKNKPFQFHGPKWLRLFDQQNESCKNNQIHEMSSGHWIMKKYPKFITDLIIRRIKNFQVRKYN